jgi:hypothetical protein
LKDIHQPTLSKVTNSTHNDKTLEDKELLSLAELSEISFSSSDVLLRNVSLGIPYAFALYIEV